MTKPQFMYVIYIRATPTNLEGSIDPEMTRKYWMHENISDWKAGSPWTHKRTDPAGTVDIVGQRHRERSPAPARADVGATG